MFEIKKYKSKVKQSKLCPFNSHKAFSSTTICKSNWFIGFNFVDFWTADLNNIVSIEYYKKRMETISKKKMEGFLWNGQNTIIQGLIF